MNETLNINLLLKNGFGIFLLIFILLLALAPSAQAGFNWTSVTFDNDLFIGDDSGYTNGLFLSIYETESENNTMPEHDFWVTPLMWSMPQDEKMFTVNSYSIGQTMATPSNLSIENPPRDELPYSALLAVTNSYLIITPEYSDCISTTVGIIGPAAFGEETQKFVHKITGSKEPKGWDTQLKNELVFQFSRARVWRSWVSSSGNIDILTGIELSLGTIQSGVKGSVYIRYGRNLLSSYATTLLNSTRTSSPLSVEGGWNFYAGLQAGYTFNLIFTDGNTFRDSRSVDYDHENVGITAGLAYSWQDYSLTLAVSDANILQGEDMENLTQFGTLTFTWRL
jgi:lipid A 3-O-deacylase